MPDDDDDEPDLDDYIELSPYFERETHRAARIQYYVFSALTFILLIATVGFSTALIADIIVVERGGTIVTALIIGLAVISVGFNGAFDERNRWRYMTVDNDLVEDEPTEDEVATDDHPQQES